MWKSDFTGRASRTLASILFSWTMAAALLSGCLKEMAIQDKPVIMQEDPHAADRRADLAAPANSVPQPSLEVDSSAGLDAKVPEGPNLQGQIEGQRQMELKMELKNGQRLFEIYCSACHDRAGSGEGMITRRGFPRAVDLADVHLAPHSRKDILRKIDEGHDGPIDLPHDAAAGPNAHGQAGSDGAKIGVMPAFADRLTPEEKNQIASYVRALQFARSVPAAWLDPRDRAALNSTPRADPDGSAPGATPAGTGPGAGPNGSGFGAGPNGPRPEKEKHP